MSVITSLCLLSALISTHAQSHLCDGLMTSGRQISVIIASDIDGGWRTVGGSSKSGQCRNQMRMIHDTFTTIKQPESGISYPSYIVSYVEFDRDGYSIIVGPNDDVNQMPITTTEFNDTLNLIENRCDAIYQDRTCSDVDGEKTQLKELLIDIRDNESKYGFDTTSAEYIGQDRDRYIILFNSCKLPSSEVHDICDEMEDYIRAGGDFGINVIIINQGSDGFLGQTDADDYILCLTEYDQDRIYTNEARNEDTFDTDGLEGTIGTTICDKAPTSNPTLDPTSAPTTAPTEAPSASSVPTPSPTFSNNTVYVRDYGCDYGSYCSTDESSSSIFCKPWGACQSIQYAWNCFHGDPTDVCQDQGLDGNGIFDLGDGTWDFPYNLNYDDGDIIIRGQGTSLTTLRYTGSEPTWIQCRWYKCYISLQDLTITSNRTSKNDIQFHMYHGGTLYFRNVVFVGSDYVENENNPFWVFNGDRVNVIFEDCYFYNNNALYEFSNGVSATFKNCGFAPNDIQFYINSSDIIFNDCRFVQSKRNDESLFIIGQSSTITINNTDFRDTIDDKSKLFDIQSIDNTISLSNVFVEDLSYNVIEDVSYYFTFANLNNANNTQIITDQCHQVYEPVYPQVELDRSNLSKKEVFEIAGEAVDQNFTCNHATSCGIICNNSVSCFLSEFEINSDETIILCETLYSCGRMTADINPYDFNSSSSTSFQLVCDKESSCKEAVINVDQVDIIEIDCINFESCAGSIINITDSVNATVTCHHASACDELHLITDSNTSQLIMYQGSNDVIYEMPSGYTEDRLVCNPNSSSYLSLGDGKSGLDALSDIYDINPCEGITIKCNVFNISNECDMEYYELDNIDFGFINMFSCYHPLSIESVLGTRCIGTCPQSPTESPTSIPTAEPTMVTDIPTNAPTQAPTLDPTDAPTFSPTKAPTPSPTMDPTDSPTLAPTLAPTDSPTNNPTTAPSLAPTAAPTNNPIASKDFDHFISITYLLQNVNEENKIQIVNDPVNETMYIIDVIKQKYARVQERFPSFEHFLVSISDIEGTEIVEINTRTQFEWINLDTLKLNAKIECNEDDDNINYCASIQQQSVKNNNFYDRVAADLRMHYNNQQLDFSSQNGNSLVIECKDCVEEPPDYVLYGLVVIVGLMYLIALLALLFNMGLLPKLPGFHYVDNGNWVALMTIGLQFWDFASDVNLAVEIWMDPLIFDNTLVLYAGIGSAAFTIIPYIANLIVAARIKEIIKNNLAAKSWFQHKANLFTLLVVFTGGSYSALALVSSNVFGLKIFGCGITRYELRQLGKMKVIYTVVIENIPQLFCQLLYSYTLGEITSSVALAFIASALSITASTLSYLIERDTSDSRVIQYYLSAECSSRTLRPGTYEEDDPYGIEMTTFTKDGKQINHLEDNESTSSDTSNKLTDIEKENLINNAGRALKLSRNIAEVFNVDAERIEVGQSMIGKYGISTHIVHCVYMSDLELMQEQMMLDNITARYYISELYGTKKIMQDITKVMRSHFELNEDFDISFQHQIGVKKSDLMRKITKKRNGLLKIGKIGLDDEDMVVDRETVTHTLHRYFESEGIGEEHDQLNFVINTIRRDLKFMDNEDSMCLKEALIMNEEPATSIGLEED